MRKKTQYFPRNNHADFQVAQRIQCAHIFTLMLSPSDTQKRTLSKGNKGNFKVKIHTELEIKPCISVLLFIG